MYVVNFIQKQENWLHLKGNYISEEGNHNIKNSKEKKKSSKELIEQIHAYVPFTLQNLLGIVNQYYMNWLAYKIILGTLPHLLYRKITSLTKPSGKERVPHI